jgi:hypothetical protein
MAIASMPSSSRSSSTGAFVDENVSPRFSDNAPLGYVGGDTNLYRYVGNDPMDETDPTGLATAFGGLPGQLQGIASTAAAKAEAARIAAAIQNTWSKGWTFYPPITFQGRPQTVWGYWCYEWAYAFERAASWEAGSGKYFTVEVWSATTDDGTKVHAWIKITSKETGQSIYVDDGFFWVGKYVHSAPPYGGAYKNLQRGVDTPRNQCSPPTAYDSSGKKVPAPPPPPGSPEPGLQSPGCPDLFGFPWIF